MLQLFHQSFSLQFNEMRLYRPGSNRMQLWIYIYVDLGYHLGNGRTWRQDFKSLDYLLFSQHSVLKIFRDFRLRISDNWSMRRHNLGYFHLLQSFQRIQIIEHITIWWRDHIRGDT